MRLKIIRFLATSAAVLAVLGASVGVTRGQVATGTLTGTITDAKGAAMAGASVTVHNEDTGADTPGTSNDTGVYTAPFLQPGTYDITASQAGFATVQNKGVRVQVGATVRIDITMPVASQQSLVTVTTEAPVLETEKTEQSQNVSESLVSNLPISSRRWEQFVMLTPGVTPDGSTGGMSFHGINQMYNNNSVDGANNNSSYNGTGRGGATSDGYVYSGDSIREFQVSGSNFTAEVGQAAGGAVNAVTRSGTNTLHGDVFENLRNPIFNALDPVGTANAVSLGQAPTQPVHQQNQFGGTVGGPLVRDKLFFIATYDGYRKVFPNIVTTQQITPAFSSSAFVCPHEITAAQCAAAKNFALTQDLGNYPQSLRQDIEFIKLDYQFNQANHFNVTTNIRDWKNPKAGNGSAIPGSTTAFLMDRFVIANWTTLIGTNKVNEARYQWGADNSWSAAQPFGGPQVALSNLFTYGAVNVPAYVQEYRHQFSDNFSITKGAHSMKMGVDINLLSNPTRGSNQSAGVYGYSSAVTGSLSSAAFTTATGCGTVAAGGSANTIFCDWLLDLYGVNIGDGRTGTHWTTFNQILDSRAAPTGSAPFAPGFAPPAGLVPPDTFVNSFNMQDYAGYFQDNWKLRPNITLNLGLRYDLEVPPPPQFGNTLTPLLTHFTSEVPPDYSGIQPRVGIAWNFTSKMVFRAGGGLFVAKTPGNLYKAFVSANDGAQVNCPPTGAGSCSSLAAGFAFPDVFLNQQDVAPNAPFTSSTLGGANGKQPVVPTIVFPAGSICPCGIRGIDPNSQRPRAYQAQVALERQLPGNMSLSATWVFTRGLHLPSTEDANVLNTGLMKRYDVVNSAGATTLVSTVPFFGGTPPGTGATPPGSGRPDNIAGPVISQFTDVQTKYNAMVLSLHKPMSRGIEILANYTLSKAWDDGQAGAGIAGGENFFATDGVISPFNRTLERGLSATDVPNRFTASVVWAPAFGKGLNRYERGVLNGWNVSSTITAANGTRYSGLVQSTSRQTLCLVATTPCPAASLVTALQGGMSGVDVATGGNSIGGRAAWLPHNSFALPNYADVDFRVAKQVTFRERYAFEIRAEAFNLFNSTLTQAVSQNAFTFAAAGSGLCGGHTNTCMTPVSSFGTATTTTANLLGSRQLQFGIRFGF